MGGILAFLALEALGNMLVCVCREREREKGRERERERDALERERIVG